jgi:hypothetical protein
LAQDTSPLTAAVDPTVPSTQTEVHTAVVTSSPADIYHWYGNPKFDDWMRFLLSFEVVSGFVWMVLYGQYSGKQPDNNTVLVYVAFVSTCIGFYLGSSYGSNNKSKTGL